MEKTYYDILEVSRYASDEVIKRAHKVLIKKYHPDLKTGNETESEIKEAEERIRKINEAYEILTDPGKKAKYDNFLKNQDLLKNNSANTNTKKEENSAANNKPNGVYDERAVQMQEVEIANQKLKDEVEKRVSKAQEDIDKEQIRIKNQMQEDYMNYLRSLGYKVKTKDNRSFKEKMKSYLIIGIIILVFFIILSIIYKVPSLSNKMLELEQDNLVVKIISSIFRMIINGIWGIFGL